jgi:hypothetical protein
VTSAINPDPRFAPQQDSEHEENVLKARFPLNYSELFTKAPPVVCARPCRALTAGRRRLMCDRNRNARHLQRGRGSQGRNEARRRGTKRAQTRTHEKETPAGTPPVPRGVRASEYSGVAGTLRAAAASGSEPLIGGTNLCPLSCYLGEPCYWSSQPSRDDASQARLPALSAFPPTCPTPARGVLASDCD